MFFKLRLGSDILQGEEADDTREKNRIIQYRKQVQILDRPVAIPPLGAFSLTNRLRHTCMASKICLYGIGKALLHEGHSIFTAIHRSKQCL